MQQALYSPQCGVTAACVLHLVEELMKQWKETDRQQLYFGNLWFASVTCVTELWKWFNVCFIGAFQNSSWN